MYLLVDGIYNEYKNFVKTISSPISLIEKLWARKQEGRRKDMERLFGVLQARCYSLISKYILSLSQSNRYALALIAKLVSRYALCILVTCQYSIHYLC
jgi:hypothetical protein